jgi:hypothetical protein
MLDALRQPVATDVAVSRQDSDRSIAWLRAAVAGLFALAVAAAAVSFTAQYQMIFAERGLKVVSALEAAIPDAAALVFACLGVALALHGRRAARPRALNVASVGVSVFMNAIAASPGWRSLAVWAMPPVAYALASDTLIGVVRAWVIARQQELDEALADDEASPFAVLGGLALWWLRLIMAPRSTASGFRAWALTECPVAPGRRVNGTATRQRRRQRRATPVATGPEDAATVATAAATATVATPVATPATPVATAAATPFVATAGDTTGATVRDLATAGAGRDCVTATIHDHPEWDNKVIAAHCGVNVRTVQRRRERLARGVAAAEKEATG